MSNDGSPESYFASPTMLDAVSDVGSSPSESLLLSSEDDVAPVDSAARALASDVLSPEDYPESGILLCSTWLGPSHPVRPGPPLAVNAEQQQQRSHFRFTFHSYKVITVEKFIDDTFEYSFAYEYWPSGSIRCVVTTRARLGVQVEQFDDV